MISNKNLLTVTSWNQTGELSRFAYREGYRKAADALVLDCINQGHAGIDGSHARFGLIYPIMFLYRHYLEIEFKDVLALSRMTSLGSAKEIRGHDLQELWSTILECTEAVQGADVRQEFEDACGITVDRFQNIDPFGDAFRYPTNIKGRAQWGSPFEIDIEKIRSDVTTLEKYCYELRDELRSLLDPGAEDMSDRTYFY